MGLIAWPLASSQVDTFIEDEAKEALPRLEDIKRLGAAGKERVGEKASPFLTPSQMADLKRKERKKEKAKGAPAYFDTMKTVTWTAITIMVVVEVLINTPLVHLPEKFTSMITSTGAMP
jgi:hypothetical protein